MNVSLRGFLGEIIIMIATLIYMFLISGVRTGYTRITVIVHSLMSPRKKELVIRSQVFQPGFGILITTVTLIYLLQVTQVILSI